MPGGRETGDIANLGKDQHRGVAANTTDLAEHRDTIVCRSTLLNLACRCRDLPVKIIDQRKQTIQAAARSLPQL